MAIKLTSKENTEAVSTAYPFGNIKDDTGSGDGTPVDKAVYADFHQFFEKLMNAAGVTHNNLPDNQTNGFQLFDALKKIILDSMQGEDWHQISTFSYRKGKDGFVYTKGYIKFNESITLPSGYRPASQQIVHSSGMDQSGVASNSIYIYINADGTITSPFFGTNPTDLFLILIDTSFKIG